MSAQSKTKTVCLYGTVHNRMTGELLSGVKAELMTRDSSVVGDCCTEKYFQVGNTLCPWYFYVPKKEAQYILKLSKEGYETLYKDITYEPRGNKGIIIFEKTYLKYAPKERVLGAATVTATRVKFYTKKDTVVFNADAFEMAEGSMLDALIKQLPGVELRDNGQIYVNGRFVESLLLNGENFFDKDRNVMLENLPSYMVNNVKVYERLGEKSRLMKRDMDDKSYVMDINLKKHYSIGWIGNAEGGAGTRDRYLGRFFALRFTRQSRVSLFGNMNNLNETRKPGQNGDWSPGNVRQGQNAHKIFGLDYMVNDRRTRYKLEGWAKAEHDNLTALEQTTGEAFMPNGNVYKRGGNHESQSVTSFNSFHNWLFHNDLTVIKVAPYVLYEKKKKRGNSYSAALNRDMNGLSGLTDSLFSGSSEWLRNAVINRVKNEDMQKSDKFFTTATASFTQDLRYFSGFIDAEGYISYKKEHFERFNHYQLDYPSAAGQTGETKNRYYKSPSEMFSYYGRADFWYWLPCNFALVPSYKYRVLNTRNDNMIYRLEQLDGWGSGKELGALPSEWEYLSTLDKGNSYNQEQNTQEHTISMKINGNHLILNNKVRFEAYAEFPVVLTRRKFDYVRANIDTVLTKQVAAFNPFVRTSFIWHDWKRRIDIEYDVDTKLYGLSQTLDIRSDDDPLRVTLGNGRLKNSVAHQLDVSYTNNSNRKQRFFNAGVNYNAVRNQIGYSSEYNRATGVYTYRPVNINGNYSVGGNVNYSMALDRKRRWNLSTTTSAQLHNNVDLITVTGSDANPRSKVKTLFLNETVKIDHRFGRQKVGAKAGCSWRNATSAREDFSTINAANFNYGLTGQFELPCGFQLFTDLTMYSRRGYEAHEMNTDELVWNARLSKQVWKKRLTLALEGFDILHNLSAVTHTLNGQGRTETYRNVIPSYGMLHVIYRLNIQPKKK
ncbi:MAG: outer membrane beta-barrel protein [Prevotellamassilia sp.]|nr:outer membrane beta-barrel protein [Prevotellamassilia sp.]